MRDHGRRPRRAPSDFAGYYATGYPRLAAQLYAYLGDATEAEDLAQEAYLRAWRSWSKISQYDDPVGWVRHVAWNLATSRLRQLATATPAYGDLTGDGRPEAVLAIRCSVFPDGSAMEQEGAQILVVTMRPDHSLVGLQFVGTVHAEYPSFHVDGGRLYVQMRYNHASANSWGSSYLDAAFTQVYLWNGASFALIAGRTSPLNFTGAHNGYGVPSQLADILSSDGQVLCPAALVPFAYAPFSKGGYVYGGPGGRQEARPVDVDGDGNEEIVVAVNCAGPDYDAVSLYVLTQGTDRFVTLDVPLANDDTYTLESFEATTAGLTLTVSSATEGRQVKVLFWDGTGYQPSYGTYRLAVGS